MNKLRGSSVYLVGPVDHADNPNAWRQKVTDELLEPLGIKVYNPLVKPTWLDRYSCLDDFSKYYEVLNKINSKCLEKEDIKILNGMKHVRDFCLRMAEDCNFMIVNLPKTFTVGTFEEIKVATDAGKPVLYHFPDGIPSTWLPVQDLNFNTNHLQLGCII